MLKLVAEGLKVKEVPISKLRFSRMTPQEATKAIAKVLYPFDGFFISELFRGAVGLRVSEGVFANQTIQIVNPTPGMPERAVGWIDEEVRRTTLFTAAGMQESMRRTYRFWSPAVENGGIGGPVFEVEIQGWEAFGDEELESGVTVTFVFESSAPNAWIQAAELIREYGDYLLPEYFSEVMDYSSGLSCCNPITAIPDGHGVDSTQNHLKSISVGRGLGRSYEVFFASHPVIAS